MKKFVLFWFLGSCVVTVQAQERQLSRKIRGEAPTLQTPVNTAETPAATPAVPAQVSPSEVPPAAVKEEQPKAPAIPETAFLQSRQIQRFYLISQYTKGNPPVRKKHLSVNQPIPDESVLFSSKSKKISATWRA